MDAALPGIIKHLLALDIIFSDEVPELLPAASENVWVHIGNCTNMIYCDPDNNLVVVARWIDQKAMDGFIKHLPAALSKP